MEAALNCSYVREFDEFMTAKVNGFKDAIAMYKHVSSKYVIKDIAIPTLFIHSLDDPVCIKECIPYELIKENPNCMLITTEKGGHIEWFTGANPKRWAFIPTFEFLSYQAGVRGNN